MIEQNGHSSIEQLRGEIQRLTTALEEVVALALSAGDPKQRASLMHRRAAAALSGADRKPLTRSATDRDTQDRSAGG